MCERGARGKTGDVGTGRKAARGGERAGAWALGRDLLVGGRGLVERTGLRGEAVEGLLRGNAAAELWGLLRGLEGGLLRRLLEGGLLRGRLVRGLSEAGSGVASGGLGVRCGRIGTLRGSSVAGITNWSTSCGWRLGVVSKKHGSVEHRTTHIALLYRVLWRR